MPHVVTNFLSLSAFAFVAATLAVAYYRFTQPGEVLAWWDKLLHSAHSKIAEQLLKWDGYPLTMENGVWKMQQTEWVLKPILTCETCIAGQFSLWLFLLVMPFNWLSLFYCIALATTLAPIILKLTKA